ncbi:MAG: zf-HC2 domain-containing protein [Acidobacteriota bacterium]|nr:zf-HC2 domain-containing protein [Acidobacteriota bacterium]MDP3717314.1 zf-HC2 domain-containing protein [Acidobacteriota bacterium]
MSKAKTPAATAHCRVTPLHWSQYLDGEFSTAECRRCEAHLQGCESCRRKLQGLRRLVRACRAAGAKAVPVTVRATARRRARALLSRSRR